MTAILTLPFLTCGLCLAAEPPVPTAVLALPTPGNQGNHTTDPAGPSAPVNNGVALSDAERIARVQRNLDRDRKRAEELQKLLDDNNGEFAQAEKAFRALDDSVAQARLKLQVLKRAGKEDEATKMAADNEPLERQWQEARDRFDLAIQERKIQQQELTALGPRIELEKKDLARLTAAPADPKAAGASPPPAEKAAAAKDPNAAAKTDPTHGTATEPATAGVVSTSRPPSRHLADAQEELRKREATVEQARNKVQLITDRLDSYRTNVELEQKLCDTARKRGDQAQEELAALTRELARKKSDNAAPDVTAPVQKRSTETEARLNLARADQSASTDRLQELQVSVNRIQIALAKAQKDLEQKQAAAEEAQQRVAQLENPWSLPNLLQWLTSHGPRVALILLAMLGLNRLISLTSRRILTFMARHGRRNTVEENESRAQTLVGVFRNAFSLMVLGGGLLMVLDEVGIPIMPLLGGAAVLGLAVAFGAQNLIRDYFSGFMVLMEDQYGINDVVKIGGVSGTVEKITLRMTVLRDMAGVVHFIPHGTINTVSNLTHGWSQALFDIPVSAGEDVDHVMGLLIDLGKELRHEPAFTPLILEGPEMLGVDELADGKVVLRFFIKTRPLKQWLVKREMLRRIKHRFDELGVGSPFSHQDASHKTVLNGAKAVA
jgi:small conductance mechanosensitive channel